ncbi:hypothetical protein CDAR_50371 [Caerostris darwini]|uniref:Uncharacterized protein n=1 Tax=Caerostris darwini TaxID=1538125 RepID=A0AAV4UYJ0_9ARAC|nr:hypothetical protein CDAR_50371 [Caerostris darwini]
MGAFSIPLTSCKLHGADIKSPIEVQPLWGGLERGRRGGDLLGVWLDRQTEPVSFPTISNPRMNEEHSALTCRSCCQKGSPMACKCLLMFLKDMFV